MPILYWDDEPFGGTVLDWGDVLIEYEIPTFELFYLHASVTSTMYHAEGTTGESTDVVVEHNLVDEDLNTIVDEAGNQIIVYDTEQAILFHAKATDTLYHAEA